ncbi:BgtTE-56107 [Blumeria graminis f. sp. tritici]|uniref:BgtTE-56107 n=1 Tax=Blumeria graminis f. sp. tritici TaxID=62690 RepID=A0A9X9QEZ5_BLUGR|nr:BgtTE-56107 [Blumeria graminis f. sp. tritici]
MVWWYFILAGLPSKVMYSLDTYTTLVTACAKDTGDRRLPKVRY